MLTRICKNGLAVTADLQLGDLFIPKPTGAKYGVPYQATGTSSQTEVAASKPFICCQAVIGRWRPKPNNSNTASAPKL